MSGRNADPQTPYRVYLHTVGKKYVYAAVQKPFQQEGSNRLKYKPFHLGRVSPEGVFTPNAEFLLLPVQEQAKYIFPESIDISNLALQEIDASIPGNAEHTERDEHPNEEQLVSERFERRLYGDWYYGSVWLLAELSRINGVESDLLETFGRQYSLVQEILSLSFYAFVSGRDYNRFVMWQRTHRTLIDYEMPPKDIVRLSKNITDYHRMKFIQLRLGRQPAGQSPFEIEFAGNAHSRATKSGVEVIAYSPVSHEPVYWKRFSGDTEYIPCVRNVLGELHTLGIRDAVFVERRIAPPEEVLTFLAETLPFVVRANVECEPVMSLIQQIALDDYGIPEGMTLDEKKGVYSLQATVPYHVRLEDGTDVKAEELGVYLTLDVHRRTVELGNLRNRIQSERSVLENAEMDGIIPANIKKYNALFDFFKVEHRKDKKGKRIGITWSLCENKVMKARILCGFSAMLSYHIDKNKAREIWTRPGLIDDFAEMSNIWENASKEQITGRSFFYFVGVLALSFLQKAWNGVQNRFDSFVDMMDEMEPIRYILFTDGTVAMSRFTERQAEICEACSVKVPDGCEP